MDDEMCLDPFSDWSPLSPEEEEELEQYNKLIQTTSNPENVESMAAMPNPGPPGPPGPPQLPGPLDPTCAPTAQPQANFACPYFQMFPTQENIVTKSSCVTGRYGDITRLREHLKRCHVKDYMCSRCGDDLKNMLDLQRHLASSQPCQPKLPDPCGIIMTPLQWAEIGMLTKKHQHHEVKWMQIFKILFPSATVIPSPYSNLAETFKAQAQASESPRLV